MRVACGFLVARFDEGGAELDGFDRADRAGLEGGTGEKQDETGEHEHW
jgi:hypothetical protein